MSGHDELWQRVHAHLDAGRDPIDDVELVDALADHPDQLAAVVRLRGRLATLPEAARPGRRSLRLAIAAAAACLMVAAVLVVRSTSDEPTPPESPGRVLTFEVVLSRPAGGDHHEHRIVRRTGGRPDQFVARHFERTPVLSFNASTRDDTP